MLLLFSKSLEQGNPLTRICIWCHNWIPLYAVFPGECMRIMAYSKECMEYFWQKVLTVGDSVIVCKYLLPLPGGGLNFFGPTDIRVGLVIYVYQWMVSRSNTCHLCTKALWARTLFDIISFLLSWWGSISEWRLLYQTGGNRMWDRATLESFVDLNLRFGRDDKSMTEQQNNLSYCGSFVLCQFSHVRTY